MKEYYLNTISYISKSVDGRPSIVFIDEKDDSMVSLKPTPGIYDKALFVPKSQMFEGDRDLFSRLKAAYESHDVNSLRCLWMEAKSMKDAM